MKLREYFFWNLVFQNACSFSLSGLFLILLILPSCDGTLSEPGNSAFLYQFDNNQETRWSSPENKNGVKGKGGMERDGGKGHPCDAIGAGQTYTLLDIQEQGIINRIWITIAIMEGGNYKSSDPEMLRSLKIEMFWDNESKPAVSVPFGDFFCAGLGKTTVFENALFANPEGRSYNCFIPMPFRKAAKIQIVNESNRILNFIFFDVNYSLTKKWDKNNLYFHSYWHRDTATILGEDFEILPEVTGKGRFLGTNIGVICNPKYNDSWFGEGEVKMYLDGDSDFPTLVGTGTEDYIGSAWGQGRFINKYTGCTLAGGPMREWAFYRFHIPDPVYFKKNFRTTIQQLGGDYAADQYKHAEVIVTRNDSIVKINPNDKFKNVGYFYRSEDVSATAYFYLDIPVSNLPALQDIAIRTFIRGKQN